MNTDILDSSGDGEAKQHTLTSGGASWNNSAEEAVAYAELRQCIAREGLRVEIQPGRLRAAYDLGSPVGRGKFATVYKATRRADGAVVALKALSIFDVMDSRSREKCLREIRLVQSLDHPHIIHFIDGFVDGARLILVFEFAAAGDLKRQLRKAREKHARFEEAVIWKYFAQIAAAVAHMHSRRIIHRDLKPANVMLTLTGQVKVGDFGLGRLLGHDTLAAHSKVGTPLYMAPEVLRGGGHDSAADVWSTGCILYELAMIQSPFRQPGLSLASLFDLIQRAEYPPLSDVYSQELRTLVANMLQVDPLRRPTMATVLLFAEKMRDVTAAKKAEAKALAAAAELACGRVASGSRAPSARPGSAPTLLQAPPSRGTSARTITATSAVPDDDDEDTADETEKGLDDVRQCPPSRASVTAVGTPPPAVSAIARTAPIITSSHFHDHLSWLGFFAVDPPLLALSPVHAAAEVVAARARSARDRFFFARSSSFCDLVATASWLASLAAVGPRADARDAMRASAVNTASHALFDAAAVPLAVASTLAIAVRDCENGMSLNAAGLALGHGADALALLTRFADAASLSRAPSIATLQNASVPESAAAEATSIEGKSTECDEGEAAVAADPRRDAVSPHAWASEVSRVAPRLQIIVGADHGWRDRLDVSQHASAKLSRAVKFDADTHTKIANASEEWSEARTRILQAEAALMGEDDGKGQVRLRDLAPLAAEAREAEGKRREQLKKLETSTAATVSAATELYSVEEAITSVSDAADSRVTELCGSKLVQARRALVLLKRQTRDLEVHIGVARALQPQADAWVTKQ